MDSDQEAGEGLACPHLRRQHYWDGGAPLFHSQKPGSGKVRDHPEITAPGPRPASASAVPLPKVPGALELRMVLGSPDSCLYPTRLFQMNVGPPKELEELDPETWEYWRLLRKHNIWRQNRLSKYRKF